MPLLAVFLVGFSALTHASWNFLAKKAAHSAHFVWFYSTGTVILYLPAVAWIVGSGPNELPGPPGWLCLLATALLHLAYSNALQAGYRHGDLSLVYPIARGTGPLISFFGAIVVLGESPRPMAVASALSIVTGVFLLARAGRGAGLASIRRGIGWGVFTGIFIAAYTLNDGYAVKILGLSPILVDYSGNLFRALALAPRALARRADTARDLRRHWHLALGVAILGPWGYIFVLYAMRIAPVSHVAPARELSMLVAAYLGARLLNEGALLRRLLASAFIVAGVVGLAIS